MIPKFRAYQIKGELFVYKNEMFREYLLSLSEKILDVVVKEHKESRSDRQNKYAHGVVFKMISDETGYSLEEAKDLCKSMFLKKWVTVNGKEIEIVRGSADLNTKEFEDFMEDCRRWAAQELSINVPLPGEVEL